MLLWTRPWTLQALIVLLTNDDQPSPPFLVFVSWQEWCMDLLVLFPCMILVGQVYMRLAASFRLPPVLCTMVFGNLALWTFLVQCLFADVLFHSLLCSVITTTTTFSTTTTTTPRWNGLLAVFYIRFVVTWLGLSVGERFFPLVLTGGIACGKSTVSKVLQKQARIRMIDTDVLGHLILLPPWHADLHQPNALVRPQDSVYVRILETFGDNNSNEDKDKDKDQPNQTDPRVLPGVHDQHSLLDSDKNIDRAKLGARIFANPDERRKLNSITHPKIFYCLLLNLIKALYFSWSNNDSDKDTNNNKNQTRHGRRLVCAEIPLFFETNSFVMKHLIFGLVMVVACTEEQQYQRLRRRNPELSHEACQQRIESQFSMTEKIRRADVVIWNDQEMTTSTTTTNEDNTSSVKDNNEALKQQVDKALLLIQQRMGGIMGWTLSLWMLFFSQAIFIYASIQLYLMGQ